MSILIGNRQVSQNYLRGAIQQAADKVMQPQGLVDYCEIIADGYMALDNTALDENKKKNAVTLLTDEFYVNAARAKDGSLKSFEIIDGSGEEARELRKTVEDGRATYEVSMGGFKTVISEDQNGTLVFLPA